MQQIIHGDGHETNLVESIKRCTLSYTTMAVGYTGKSFVNIKKGIRTPAEAFSLQYVKNLPQAGIKNIVEDMTPSS